MVFRKTRQDETAVGWDHHEKVEKHASQKGEYLTNLAINGFLILLET